jgi:hypothetical protein
MFRWTTQELKEFSDLQIIRAVLAERRERCTSIYSPLYKKLTELYAKVDCAINHGQTTIE